MPAVLPEVGTKKEPCRGPDPGVAVMFAQEVMRPVERAME